MSEPTRKDSAALTSGPPVDPNRGYCDGMTDALRRLRNGRGGLPTAADRPPPSLFPITRAARAALRYARQYD